MIFALEPPIIDSSLKSLATGLFLILIVASLLELSLLALRPLLIKVGKKVGLNGGIEFIVGLLLGVLLASWLALDVFSMTFNVTSNWLGVILTGVVIGQGGTWLIRVLPKIKILSNLSPISSNTITTDNKDEEEQT